MMDRRSFLKGLAVVVVAPTLLREIVLDLPGEDAAPRPEPAPLRYLWGDAYHDDAPAIQALIDGEDVFDVRAGAMRRADGVIYLEHGTYRLGAPIVVPSDGSTGLRGFHVDDCRFTCDPQVPYALLVDDPSAIGENSFSVVDSSFDWPRVRRLERRFELASP